jgi:ABC-type xylose transport system substrate-binding protein
VALWLVFDRTLLDDKEAAMKKLLLSIIGIAALVSTAGCAGLLLGTSTVGGVGLAMDTIRLERFISMEKAWAAAIDTLSQMSADITSENKTHGTINAEIEETVISIQLLEQESKTVTIDVKARKKGLPDLALADKIVEDINTKFSPKPKQP